MSVRERTMKLHALAATLVAALSSTVQAATVEVVATGLANRSTSAAGELLRIVP